MAHVKSPDLEHALEATSTNKQPTAVSKNKETPDQKLARIQSNGPRKQTPTMVSLSVSMAGCCATYCCQANTEQALINKAVADHWPAFIAEKVKFVRDNPYVSEQLGPFELRLQTAGVIAAPHLKNVNIKAQKYVGAPLVFECDIDDTSSPELVFVLVPRSFCNAKAKKFSKEAIELDIHSLVVKGRIHVKVYLESTLVEYYFVRKPGRVDLLPTFDHSSTPLCWQVLA